MSHICHIVAAPLAFKLTCLNILDIFKFRRNPFKSFGATVGLNFAISLAIVLKIQLVLLCSL